MGRVQTGIIPSCLSAKVQIIPSGYGSKKNSFQKTHLGSEIIHSIGGGRAETNLTAAAREGGIFLAILSRFRGTGDVPAGFAKQPRRRLRRRRPAKCQADTGKRGRRATDG